MGLLDLVEEDHLVRPAADRLGQLAALLVPDVAGRRPDQARHGELLHVLAHVDPGHRRVVVEQELGQRARELGLADAGRAEEQERAKRPARVAETGPGPPDRVRHGLDRLVLTDDPAVEAILHRDELLELTLHQAGDRDPGPRGDDLGDVVGRDLLAQERARALERGEGIGLLGQLLLERGQRLVLELGGGLVVGLSLGLVDPDLELLELGLRRPDGRDRGLLGRPALLEGTGRFLEIGELALERREARLRRVVGLLAERLALDLELHPAALGLVELNRHRIDLHPEPRCGLVDQVDRLVRQEPLGDVALAQGRGRDQRGVGDPDAVVDLVALAQAAQDRDRLLDCRLVDEDGLEAALEGRVLLDVLAVLVEGGRADRVELTPGEHRLEQVRRVHRALGGARADDGVELVDEQDHLAVAVLDLLEDGLQALLELTPELRPGDQRTEVERDDPLVLEPLGDVAADDPLGQAFDDRGLADSGLADQDRVVLRPAAQHLDDSPDLLIATDDRVQAACPGLGGQVATVLLEGGVGALRVRRGDTLAAAHALERAEDGLAPGAVALEQAATVTTDLEHAEQEVLGRDVLVAEPAGLLLADLEDALRARVERQRAAPDPGALAEDAGELVAERREVDAEPAERLGRDAVIGLDEGVEEVLGVEDGRFHPLGDPLSGGNRLLGFLGVSVGLHCWSPGIGQIGFASVRWSWPADRVG